jgi:hypothetical protein
LRNQRRLGTLRPAILGVAMDWMQILFAIILIGIAIELGYVVKAIGSTNRLLAALLKHIKPS